MATKRMKVMPMLMGIVTTVFISFGFSACTANEDNPSTPERSRNRTTPRLRLMA